MKPADTLEEELLRLLSRQGTRVPVAVLFIATVIAAMANGRVPTPWWLMWLTLVIAMLAVRLVVLRRAAKPSAISMDRRIRIAVILSACNGIVHGLSLTFFPFLPEIERAILSILIVGMATGAVVTTAGYLPIYLAYVIPTMLPLALLWALNPGIATSGWTEISLALLIVLFAGMLISLAMDSFRLFRESFEIRSQQAETNEKLQDALKQAEAANYAKTRFLASASHDLRQPIHTLSLFGAALTNRPLDEKSRDIAEHMNIALVALSTQLDALLDISKLDAGIVKVNREPTDMRYLLATLQEEFGVEAAEKNLSLVFDECDEVVVDTDQALLTRVIRNLIGNAIKYTSAGEVRIAVDADEHSCVVKVRDTGAGIPKDEQARIFEEFYQLDNPGRDRTKGLGLGLAIVRRLADLLDLTIDLDSSPGRGTEFIVRIPRVSGVATRPVDEQRNNPTARNLKVLVVDDETEVQLGMKTLLEGLGCQVRLADGTPSAVDIARVWTPDLLLTDLRLRGSDDGITTVESVRRERPGLPAILISGDTAPDRLKQAEDAGLPLLHKPVLPDALWRTISNVCEENNDERRELPGDGRQGC